MRNIESVVAAEVVPMLDVALPEEVISNLPPEHMDALKVVNPDNSQLTLRMLFELLFNIAEQHIPNRIAAGGELDEELFDSTIEMVSSMEGMLTPEGQETLLALYEALRDIQPDDVGKTFRGLVEAGMTNLGILTTEQTQAIGNGTGYVDNYAKLFDQREDGYYYQDRRIGTEVFVCREVLSRGRIVVMMFRNGEPVGALFQRFTGELNQWCKCVLHPKLQELMSDQTGLQSLATITAFAKEQKQKA